MIRHQLIHAFMPLIIDKLNNINERQTSVIIESLKIFETLLSIVDPSLRMLTNHIDFCPTESCHHACVFDLGTRLSSLIIPLFIKFLPDSNLSVNVKLNTYTIERIQYLIPIYSNEFRLVLQTHPELRTKLESAIRRQQQLKQQRDGKESRASSKVSLASSFTNNSQTSAPTLPLRIDFSNFKSS